MFYNSFFLSQHFLMGVGADFVMAPDMNLFFQAQLLFPDQYLFQHGNDDDISLSSHLQGLLDEAVNGNVLDVHKIHGQWLLDCFLHIVYLNGDNGCSCFDRAFSTRSFSSITGRIFFSPSSCLEPICPTMPPLNAEVKQKAEVHPLRGWAIPLFWLVLKV